MTSDVVAATDPAERRQGRPPAHSSRLPLGVTAALLVVLGFVLRLWHLGDVPFGFHVDEGHNALDALAIADGWRPVFLPGNNGREPLFAYLMALPLALLGPSIWAARLAGVVAGTVFLPAQFTLAGGLPLPGRHRTALIACALTAFTFWPVSQARYALRAGLLPLWVALWLWAWWRVLEATLPNRAAQTHPPSTRRSAAPPGRITRSARRVADSLMHPTALAGLFLAAAAYTHLAGRLLPIALVVSALWVAVRTRRREPIVAMVSVLILAGILLLPLAGYFVQHPDMLALRADQVSVLNPEVHGGDLVGTLRHNGRRLLEMPFLRGDTSWYHNLRDRPVFDPIMGAFFLIGAAFVGRDLAGRRGLRAQAAAVLLTTTLALMLALSLLSVGAPNYVRLTGAWPVLFLLAAHGLERAAALVDRRIARRPGGGVSRRPTLTGRHAGTVLGGAVLVGAVLVCAVLTLSALASVRDYFVRYAPRTEVYDAFNGPAVDRGLILADRVADRSHDGAMYVSSTVWRQAVLRFLLAGKDVRTYDLTAGLVLPPSDDAMYAFEASETDAISAFASQNHGGIEREDVAYRLGSPAVVLFHASAVAADPLRNASAGAGFRTVEARFGDRIALQAVRIEPVAAPREVTVHIALVFRALAPTALDHNLFVHVVNDAGQTVGQFDGAPLAGSYGTDRWRPGETIVQPVRVELRLGNTAGRADVLLGWYDWRTGARLPVIGDDDGAVLIGAIGVEED